MAWFWYSAVPSWLRILNFCFGVANDLVNIVFGISFVDIIGCIINNGLNQGLVFSDNQPS